jgi:hypothetical protein
VRAFFSRPLVLGLLGGLVGMGLVLVLAHLWTDHRALHQIIDLINQQAQQAQQAPGAPKK